MAKLAPYLNFPGTALEAMEHYRSIFGGELTSASYSQFGVVPAEHEHAGRIMHSQLIGDVVTLMAADELPGMGPEVAYGDNITMALTGPEMELFQGWFDRLAEGGEVVMPIAEQVWGDYYGMVKDRFGIGWMFNIENPKAEARNHQMS